MALMDKHSEICVISKSLFVRQELTFQKFQMDLALLLAKLLILNQVNTALRGTCVMMIHIVVMKENVNIN